MQQAIERFLRYLRVERNASALTIKSYGEDLETLAEYLQEVHGRLPVPDEITPLQLRDFVGALHEAGYAPTSIARKLASLRSFYRFAQRRGSRRDESRQTFAESTAAKKTTSFPDNQGDW